MPFLIWPHTDANPDNLVDCMWGQVEASGGRVRVSDLVDRSGWSHRHVTTRFSEQVGITPKAAVGVVRFVNASADLGRLPWPRSQPGTDTPIRVT